jgi:uncharacterized membrane protein YozB (DUF420 family)
MILKKKSKEEEYNVLSIDEKENADRMSRAYGVGDRPYQQMSLETFAIVVVLSTLILIVLYGILLPVPSPTANVNNTAVNNTVTAVANGSAINSSKSTGFLHDISNLIRNQDSEALEKVVYTRIMLSLLMILCFLISYSYVKKAQTKDMLIYIFIFTSMAGTSGPISTVSVILGGAGVVGGAAGGLIGAYFAFWTLQDRGFLP